MINDILEDAEQRMKGAISSFQADLDTYRTGRASPAMLDRIVVDMYGSEMRIIELASVSVPEPQQLAIKPYDPSSISAIEKGILKSELGLTPNNDGVMIRLFLPPLTEERRRDLSKSVSKRLEEAKVAIRNVRRGSLNDLRELKTEKMVSEDEFSGGQDRLQKVTDSYIAKAESAGKAKEEEIMTI